MSSDFTGARRASTGVFSDTPEEEEEEEECVNQAVVQTSSQREQSRRPLLFFLAVHERRKLLQIRAGVAVPCCHTFIFIPSKNKKFFRNT
ncbi:hypothetical protein F2P81_000162 [Scophthalmus maximus]|uniref:Uncharacterized protein n=1 Tax=Scophthalmus maximus TaxID=52904 RepID=A0A6A4TNW4_SCOMX|nr:hypothetical protein F2P81_000162 [Scophthalmus maximus]